MPFTWIELAGIGLALAVTLRAGALAVGVPMLSARQRLSPPRSAWAVVAWAGLRGGIGGALALSLSLMFAQPRVAEREVVPTLTP